MARFLEVDCFLCEKPRLSKPDDDWLEIGTMGPHRRVHSSCFHEIKGQIREINAEDPLAFLGMVEKRERARGVEPPPRDPKLIAQLSREHDWRLAKKRERMEG